MPLRLRGTSRRESAAGCRCGKSERAAAGRTVPARTPAFGPVPVQAVRDQSGMAVLRGGCDRSHRPDSHHSVARRFALDRAEPKALRYRCCTSQLDSSAANDDSGSRLPRRGAVAPLSPPPLSAAWLLVLPVVVVEETVIPLLGAALGCFGLWRATGAVRANGGSIRALTTIDRSHLTCRTRRLRS